MDKTELIIKLLSVPGVGRKSAKAIIERLNYNISSDSEFVDFVLETSIEIPRLKLDKEKILSGIVDGNEIIVTSDKQGIGIIDFTSEKYPQLLKESKDFPLILNFIGSLEAFSEKSVAIIGTREPTEYGYKVGIRLGEYFTDKGYSIVSGLAIGCDTAGHVGCLNKGGKTIAVLAHGLHTIYPKENRPLAEKILESGGLLISEYFVGQGALANFFVERDRIQAGLSKAVIVVETGIKGGTLHTVKFCNENNRPVACFNHPESMRGSDKVLGNQMLIADKRAVGVFSELELNSFESTLVDSKGKEEEIKIETKGGYIQGKLWD